MQTSQLAGLVSIVCLAAAAACSSSGGGSPAADASAGGAATGGSPSSGTGGAPASGGAATTGGAPATGGGSSSEGGPQTGSISVKGLVEDATNGTAATNFDASKYPVVSGAKVCVYGDATIPCVMTDSKGSYTLPGAPNATAFYVSYEKSGLRPELYPVAAATSDVSAPAIFMTTEAYEASFGAVGGVTADATTGIVQFGAVSITGSSTPFHEDFGGTELFYVPGYQATVTPAPKAGPIFVSKDWAADKSLKTASIAGWGFFQAAPGDYTVTFTDPLASCGSTTAKVVAGYTTTYVGVLCTLSSGDGGPPDAGSSDAGDGGK